MTYKGHIENGVVVFDEPAQLPEGANVEVSIVVVSGTPADDDTHARLLRYSRAIKDLPPYASETVNQELRDRLK